MMHKIWAKCPKIQLTTIGLLLYTTSPCISASDRVEKAKELSKVFGWADQQKFKLHIDMAITEEMISVYNNYLWLYRDKHSDYPDQLNAVLLDKTLLESACKICGIEEGRAFGSHEIDLLEKFRDPWGRSFVYTRMDKGYVLKSFGADGKPDGDVQDDIDTVKPFGVWRIHYWRIEKEFGLIVKMRDNGEVDKLPLLFIMHKELRKLVVTEEDDEHQPEEGVRERKPPDEVLPTPSAP